MPFYQFTLSADSASARKKAEIECLISHKAGCCGAIRYHNGDADGGLNDMRRNIDAWTPLLEANANYIVANASGCGQMIREYGHLLKLCGQSKVCVGKVAGFE